jgi:hypothetical protein
MLTRKKKILWLVACLAVLVMNRGCKDSGVGPVDNLPADLALYLSLDGGSNNAGLWILDANTLQLVDSLGTGQGVPWTVEFSPDHEMLYSIWTEYPSRIHYLHAVDNRSLSVVRKIRIAQPQRLVTDKTKAYLITYPDRPIEVYNRESMTLVHKDTTIETAWQIVASANHQRLYMAIDYSDREFQGIAVYNLTTFRVERIISVAHYERQRRMQPAALAISPDDRYAFLSAFNWRGGGGYNSFIVVELSTGTVIGEYDCGAFAQLGVSPDARYVYITDPAGYLYQMPFTNQILRYNVNSRSMEVFVSLSDLELGDTVFKPDKILVAPDNRTIYVSLWAAGSKNREGKRVQLLKIDAHTRKIIGTFSLPLDENGNVTQLIRNVRFGYRPK